MTKFYCLIIFISRNIGQYVYCNCLLDTLFIGYKRHLLEYVAVISNFFCNAHAQMRRFPCKQTSCWRQLLQSWCFQGAYTFVEKYGKAKVNNQHLLLNFPYVVVLSHFSVCLSEPKPLSFLLQQSKG